MSALSINGTVYLVDREGWDENPDYPAAIGLPADGGAVQTVTDARDHRRTVRFRSPELDWDDAIALEDLLAAPGDVELSGWLVLGDAVRATAHDVQREPNYPLYGRVTCVFWIDDVTAVDP